MLPLALTFGMAGTARPFLGDGWLKPDADWHRTQGRQSTLTLPWPRSNDADHAADLYVELQISPNYPRNKLFYQTLILRVNDHICAATEIQGGDDATLGYDIPEDALAGETALRISLHCPDAVSPFSLQMGPDNRLFAFKVRRLTLRQAPPRPSYQRRRMAPLFLPGGVRAASRAGDEISAATFQANGLTASELMMRFESMGTNCEFGTFQQYCGARPLGLLRFNAAPLANLLDGLENQFAGADDPALIRLQVGDKIQEYYMTNDRYGFRMHTFRYFGRADEADLHRQMVTSMRFLRRRFLETLNEAEKIFVYQRTQITTEAHMLPLLRRLRAYGPNRLVYITEDEMIAAGTVDDLGSGLYHGYIDQLSAHIDAHSVNLAPWLSICANTLALAG